MGDIKLTNMASRVVSAIVVALLFSYVAADSKCHNKFNPRSGGYWRSLEGISCGGVALAGGCDSPTVSMSFTAKEACCACGGGTKIDSAPAPPPAPAPNDGFTWSNPAP